MSHASKELLRVKDYEDFTHADNKYGLPMKMVRTGDTVESDFHIPAHMAGWRSPKVVAAHPGAVDTALTTVMGQGAMALLKRAAMLKAASTEYFDLVPVETGLKCAAKVVGKRDDNEVVIDGKITGADGRLLAHSTATYALYTPAELRQRAMCGDKVTAEFERILAAL